ncbi:MAG: YccF domain-containing protein [Candidatus Marinimicrobia bacterium]|nr:YccF domain-containing protein [Candidatus Neomarinimicrobiota bacterium]
MSFLGNILWIIFGGGLFLFLEYVFGGILLCLTIIGIPFGIQLIKLSYLGLVPFGKEIRSTQSSAGCLSTIFNVIWILTGGIVLTITHLIFAFLCTITIIGIPFAIQHLKLAAFSLAPFGREID